jgi:hypothetical protein
VIDDQLAIVFFRMLNEAVGKIANAGLLEAKGINHNFAHTFVAMLLAIFCRRPVLSSRECLTFFLPQRRSWRPKSIIVLVFY